MKILALDSSGLVASVALVEDDILVVLQEGSLAFLYISVWCRQSLQERKAAYPLPF